MNDKKQKVMIVTGVLAGYVTWWVIGIAGFAALRRFWPGYAALEPNFAFTLPMLLARLALGIVCSVVAGALAAIIAKRLWPPTLAIGFVILLQFIPAHIQLWHIAPLWYHVFFLGTLVPWVVLGGMLGGVPGGVLTKREKNQ
ncbi:MAG TPA: hypothetical protein VMH83_06955 [Candidatus Acidoferrum sp.]|nr:hypothetical protein [Candidatus Acidoferrum sp.]